MPFQSVPNCVSIVIKGNIGTKEIAHVLHAYYPDGYTQAATDALAASIDEEVGTSYLGGVAIGVNYLQTVVTGLGNIVDVQSTSSVNAGPGTDGTVTLPSNVSLCVSLRSAFTGRSARGRFFAWPTSPTELEFDNLFFAAYATGVVTFLNNVKADCADNGAILSIVSRFSAGVERPLGTHFTVTDIVARNLICDSQRGRLPANH